MSRIIGTPYFGVRGLLKASGRLGCGPAFQAQELPGGGTAILYGSERNPRLLSRSQPPFLSRLMRQVARGFAREALGRRSKRENQDLVAVFAFFPLSSWILRNTWMDPDTRFEFCAPGQSRKLGSFEHSSPGQRRRRRRCSFCGKPSGTLARRLNPAKTLPTLSAEQSVQDRQVALELGATRSRKVTWRRWPNSWG